VGRGSGLVIDLLDRNFPGTARIARLTARTHVLIRLKSDIPLRRISGILADGSYIAELSGDGVTMTVRVIEYFIDVGGQVVRARPLRSGPCPAGCLELVTLGTPAYRMLAQIIPLTHRPGTSDNPRARATVESPSHLRDHPERCRP